MMKTLRAICVLSGAAILLAASARPASAGDFYGWDSCLGCGSGGYGYGYSDGYGYGGCPASWAMDAAVGSTFATRIDYPRYVVGHGPTFPSEGYTGPRYSYNRSAEPETPPVPVMPPVPMLPAGPAHP